MIKPSDVRLVGTRYTSLYSVITPEHFLKCFSRFKATRPSSLYSDAI